MLPSSVCDCPDVAVIPASGPFGLFAIAVAPSAHHRPRTAAGTARVVSPKISLLEECVQAAHVELEEDFWFKTLVFFTMSYQLRDLMTHLTELCPPYQVCCVRQSGVGVCVFCVLCFVVVSFDYFYCSKLFLELQLLPYLQLNKQSTTQSTRNWPKMRGKNNKRSCAAEGSGK